jgi:tetratricopeptide (TPR) repeat protein
LAYLYAEEYHHRRNERLDEYVALDRALENAEAAVQLDTANHVVHGVLAKTHLYRGEYERFEIEALQTVELSPNDALWLLILGNDLVYQEDFENGLPMVAKALALSSSPPSWGRMGFFVDDYQQGRYEEALEEAMAMVMEEDFRGPLLVAAAAGQLGRAHEARQALDELRARWTRPIAEIRRELIERHGTSPAITDHLLEGLAKAGLEGVDPVGTGNE